MGMKIGDLADFLESTGLKSFKIETVGKRYFFLVSGAGIWFDPASNVWTAYIVGGSRPALTTRSDSEIAKFIEERKCL